MAQAPLGTYKKLTSAYANNEEFKIGTLNDYSSSDAICINREINGEKSWWLVNTIEMPISSFDLPLELQNFSGTNLLDGGSFVVNGNTISLSSF